ITGDTFVSAPTPSTAPPFPSLDTSYYDDLMSQAWSVLPGDYVQNSGTLNLAGGVLLVNGLVRLGGTTDVLAVQGPGAIVCTGTAEVKGNATVSGHARIICRWDLTVSGNAGLDAGCLLYTYDDVLIKTKDVVQADVVAGDWVKVEASSTVDGLVYLGTTATIQGVVNGAVYTQGQIVIDGGTVTYAEANIGRSIPGLSLR
ncbi:MAG: hypothetical protein ACE5O2_01150, partial [Armatimonadota bacterium]